MTSITQVEPLLPPTHKAVLVYTDGGCDHKGDAVGAWAYIAIPPGMPASHGVHRCGGMVGTTNNRMELFAVIEALENVEIGPRIVVTTDSEYVVKGASLWVDGWIKNGWVTGLGKPVRNRDLWERLIVLRDLHNVRFDWVKGHAGNPLNAMVDGLCTSKIKEIKQQIAAGKGMNVVFDVKAA